MRRLAISISTLLLAMPGWSADLARYAVVLNEPPASAIATRANRSAMEAARVKVHNGHAAIAAELKSRNITVTGEAHTLLNAIFVSADAAQLAQLRAMPGVSYVAPLKRFRRKLDRAEQLTNVPAAWSLLGGVTNAGAGVKIGIIDTGIEASHPAFQDPSLVPPSGFPKGDLAYTNNKIIVARSYVSSLASGDPTTSRPDDLSARDRTGHGTAVAMAAAGNTSTGPSDTITGVAPKAFLGSYKVFGSPGVNDYTDGGVIIAALEDAFSDGMDIVVLSLGAPAFSGPLDVGKTCGLSTGQRCDAEAYAVQDAVSSGMVVVAAAGNEGSTGTLQPTFNTIDSPGDAPGAITVAATTSSHNWANSLTVNGLGSFHARFGDGPIPGSTVNGPLGGIPSASDPRACSALPAGSLTGLIVLVQRGICTFADKIQNLQNAGAAGAIITNNAGDDTLITPGGLGSSSIPAVFTGYSDGQAIRGYLSANPKTTVSIDSSLKAFEVSTFNQVASFSSRGPVLGSNALKPDVAAVGSDIYLAGQTYDPNGELYAASGYLVSQGTSFSAPQVAGIAALVKQAHPNLTALQVKSAVMNTATQDVTDNGAAASVLAVGAGKANAGAAVATTLVATPGSISFGAVKAGVLPLTQQIQLTNIGNTSLSLTLAINRRGTDNNARLSVDLPNLTIPAGQTLPVNVLLSGAVPTPGIYEGFVTIQGAASTLQLPFAYIVGDGVPATIIPVAGDGDDGTVGLQPAFGFAVVQILDKYGLPVPSVAVRFAATSGGGRVLTSSATTDSYGLADTPTVLGVTPGANVYTATAGSLTTTFTATGRAAPAIFPSGAVNAANSSQGQGFAPGSYIALYGSNLAGSTQAFITPYLPVSLGQVSVSFDTSSASVPAHIWFVSAGQVNIQIPWELQGSAIAQVKVSVADSSGVLYTLPIASYSPALFEIPSGGQNVAAALDESSVLVTATSPVAQGHIVQLFANGLGPVTNQPASGQPSPTNPLATTTTTPIVTIGGQRADVKFSGMTPGTIGLYQINAVVPNTGAGIQPVTISMGGVQSSASKLPVK